MKNLGEICAKYGKTKATIKKWYEDGAPINFGGVNYSADYHLLERWRLKHFSKFGDS
jgi:hypothetical protein